ncbi:hypothetical protein FZC79_05085 [Rossellomorea vietnamensis]|uniref:Uncharacterized protein n=1 Tax=Rossellomorea vietnamensis TaxID=218284 RepID=A0A5D4KII8_9BACI|nr:hypothetical protein [Rossellomorea vietnamensis]TYR77071.1 hypothetical protein FZC79_05085 [Rossellomorea vietnamensis]
MKKVFPFLLLILLTACTSAEKEMDIIQQVERDLETIFTLNDPSKTSSNPNDYINAHLDDFENIISNKQITLDHFLKKLKKSEENSLEEYIMAAACVEILGEKNPVNEWSTGKEWY